MNFVALSFKAIGSIISLHVTTLKSASGSPTQTIMPLFGLGTTSWRCVSPALYFEARVCVCVCVCVYVYVCVYMCVCVCEKLKNEK